MQTTSFVRENFFGILAKQYELHIEGFQHLSGNVNVNASSGDVTDVTALLRAGDANYDDSVDVRDLDLLIQSFDAMAGDPLWGVGRADFDGNGLVDVEDLDILIRNFDASGDP